MRLRGSQHFTVFHFLNNFSKITNSEIYLHFKHTYIYKIIIKFKTQMDYTIKMFFELIQCGGLHIYENISLLYIKNNRNKKLNIISDTACMVVYRVLR